MNPEIPLSTFRGYLRCHRPENAGTIGRQVLTDIFPNFANLSIEDTFAKRRKEEALGIAAAEHLQAAEEVEKLLASKLNVENRRHRRYAGGDGLLPRGCYYSVCTNELGDDGGTLCRELFEYRCKTMPGITFVGDSTDREFFDRLNAGVGFKPGSSAVCVMGFPPSDPHGQTVWIEAHQEVLRLVHGRVVPLPFNVLIETNQDFHEIDNVIDLRLPATQTWFHERFTREALPYYSKITPTRPRYFVGMLPSLMNFEYGGCALTHGVGSWLRAHKVNGLIFPSARSDASVIFADGVVQDFHGWNFVDYRSAHAIPVKEGTVDGTPWDNFETRHISVLVQGLEANFTAWAVRGIESYYLALRDRIISAYSDGVNKG